MQNALDLLVSKLSSCTRYHLRSIDDDVQLFLKMNINWKSKSRSNWREHTKTWELHTTRRSRESETKEYTSKRRRNKKTADRNVSVVRSCPSRFSIWKLFFISSRLWYVSMSQHKLLIAPNGQSQRRELKSCTGLLADFIESWDLTCMFTDCLSTEWQIATLYSRCTPSTTVQIYYSSRTGETQHVKSYMWSFLFALHFFERKLRPSFR